MAKAKTQERAAPICPHLNAPCIEHGCRRWAYLQGEDPTTGAKVGDWACTEEWTTKLLIEVSIATRQAGAAVESLRNVTAQLQQQQSQTLLGLMGDSAKLFSAINERLASLEQARDTGPRPVNANLIEDQQHHV